MATPLRSIRISGKTADSFSRFTGEHGEIFYDSTNNTLRVFNGRSIRGSILADRDWVLNNTSNFSGNYNDLTNKPIIPSPPDLTGYASETYVNTAISNLVNTAPTTLDTLNELAAALGDDPNFATTIATALGEKAPSSGATLSNTVGIGFSRGVVVSEFSTDSTLAGNATDTVPTESAVKGYVDTALATKAPIDSPTFTGTVSGVTATHVGLGNVTNESKATMFTSPTFTESVNLNSSVDGYVANITGNGTSLGLKLDNSNLSSSAFSIITVAGGDAGQNVSLVAGGTAGKTSLEANGADFHLRGAQFNKDIYINVNYSQTALKISGADKSTTFYGTLTTQQSTEVLNTKTAATGSVIHDFSTGAIWYHSSISANFTANFTNIPSTFNRATVCTLILQQGATAYIPNAVQLDGTPYLINWLGGSAPSGNANKIDIVSFTLIKPTGSNFYVMGSLSTYG